MACFCFPVLVNGQADSAQKYPFTISADFHYSENSDNEMKLMQDFLTQPRLTYYWHEQIYAGIYGTFNQFDHAFESGESESGQMLGVGPLLGGEHLISDGLYFKAEVGATWGKGGYKPPVPDDINDHPDNKKHERPYHYLGVDVSGGLAYRFYKDRLEVRLMMQHNWENWERQPFDEFKEPHYPLISPEKVNKQIWRWKLGVSYRFSCFSKQAN